MSSRRDEKERLKAERLERERQAQAADRRKRLVGYGVGGVLAVAAVIAVIVALAGGGGDGETEGATGDFPEGSVPAADFESLEQAARAAGCRLQELRSEGSEHVPDDTEVEYRTNPPTSGDHFAIPAEDGAYTEAPETEALVHSLEHGRIVIQFDPALPDGAKGDLKALFDEDPYHVILTPNETGMPFEVAATAWTRSLGCPEMNEQVFDAIRAFRDEFVDQGPEFVP